MKIYYGKAVYDSKEINASISVLKNKSLSLIDGPSVKKLESKIAKTFGKVWFDGKFRFISKPFSFSIFRA